MEIEKNNIDVPEHLNEKLFQEIIEKKLKTTDVKIKKVSFKMASSPGDNYTSQIYQVHITYKMPDYTEKTTSIIIKSIPPVECTNVFDLFDVYKKEAMIYFKVLPLVKDLLPNVKFAAECYHTFREPFKTFILEDLKAQNYRTARREHGLDELHARMVLDKLGKYHAATMMFCEKEPEIYTEYKSTYFTSEMLKTEIMQNFFYGNLKEATNVAEKWPGFENIVKKLRRILDNFNEIVLTTVDSTKDTFKVLNHGDLWTNNIMFQYDSPESSRPKEVVFVDFQNGYIASPGFDLNYFLNTSLEFEVLKSKREELISHYYNSFSVTLNQLGCKDIPSENAVRKEIHRKELHGLISLCSVTPLVSCDPKHTQDSSIETFAVKSKIKAQREFMFSSPKISRILQYGLKRFDELKVLDILQDENQK